MFGWYFRLTMMISWLKRKRRGKAYLSFSFLTSTSASTSTSYTRTVIFTSTSGTSACCITTVTVKIGFHVCFFILLVIRFWQCKTTMETSPCCYRIKGKSYIIFWSSYSFWETSIVVVLKLERGIELSDQKNLCYFFSSLSFSTNPFYSCIYLTTH